MIQPMFEPLTQFLFEIKTGSLLHPEVRTQKATLKSRDAPTSSSSGSAMRSASPVLPNAMP